MGLSRLDNFIKNVRGNILYVSPNDLDSTDSIENRGNSLTRPFKTLQRALIEASRFSYQRGLNNDRFDQTTIMLYPGDHVIDNRPGWIPDGQNNFRLRNGLQSGDYSAWDSTTTFDLTNPNNALYKLNSVHGGVIIPRGTSIVGVDLRKTRVRPLYVPRPTDDTIESTAIFRVTGGCYFWQFTILDADPQKFCYGNYSESSTFSPNYSHHKLNCFEYVDGVNGVSISDSYSTYSSSRTDLDMYYEKVGLVYGTASGREIQPDYPSTGLDIQAKVDEYRIVGSKGESVGISSIKSGNGSVSSSTITVTTTSTVNGLAVDTPIKIQGVTSSGYDGQYVVKEQLSNTQFTYEVKTPPLDPLPSSVGSFVSINTDSVTSASPYIFNVSMRSTYGMCGLLADGDKSTGFKSMVVAQFTGIGLQKDANAFVKFNSSTGSYEDSSIPGNENLNTDSRAVYKPSYSNYHIKCVNDAYVQCVSVFAIGFSDHFVTDNGGEISISNSNSNFGQRALTSIGYKRNAFSQNDLGYITHIIPPKEFPNNEISVDFGKIDYKTTVGVATTSERLYLDGEKNFDNPPSTINFGYRFGARENDKLYVLVPTQNGTQEYFSRIVMPNSQSSSEKVFKINRSVAGVNSITSNTITFTESHTFENSESIRILSSTGRLPDGIDANTIYYAITSANANSGLVSGSDIKLAKTPKDAEGGSSISINNFGGELKIISRVSDKKAGDIGHPVQYDNSLKQWYVKVASASTENQIYNQVVVGLGTTSLGDISSRTYLKRKVDNRIAKDTGYRVRYVIPALSGGSVAREPLDGYILQESNTSIGSTTTEIQAYFGSGTINNVNQQRNFRFISNANWSSTNSQANILTDLPHNLSVGSQVEILNIKSGNNITGVANSGYNGSYSVVGINSAREFTINLSTNPGSFSSDLLVRDTNLPYYKRKKYQTTYYIQEKEEIQPYVNGSQDGIYYLTLLNSSVKPAISPFTSEKFSQSVRNLYPEVSRDNPVSDPNSATSHAISKLIGKVVVDDPRNSVTKETIEKFISDINVGTGITDIITSVGGTQHTINTQIDHGLNRIAKVSIASSGVNYGTGVQAEYYNAKLISIGSSTTGQHATAKVTVSATGGITNILIMHGGSAYGVGNTMQVVGIATTGVTHTPAVVRVDSVYDNVGDVIRISGVSSNTYLPYNTIYRITGVQVGASKSFTVASDPAITNVTTAGIGSTTLANAFWNLLGESLKINNITYDPTSGIATVTTNNNHALKINAKIRISSGIATIPAFNGDFVIKENISLTKFAINVGVGATTSVLAIGSSMFGLIEGITSQDGTISANYESLNGRMVPTYAGFTTTLSSGIADAVTTQISLTNVDRLGITIGDYLTIDDEIVRVKTNPANPAINPIIVFRGVFGTKPSSHAIGSVVRKIKAYPVEFRRHSISRASGHTFEYIGFGPGNYSTGLPDKHDRTVSIEEELLAQSVKKDGGINFFSGMNDRGVSFAGNKKLSSITGKEEVFETPIVTVTGENILESSSVNVLRTSNAVISNSIRVEGGLENNSLSEFNGPVNFNDRLKSTSDDGIESKLLYLQGDASISRKYTVGISTPSSSSIPGDTIYSDNPGQGGHLGWIYTFDKDWRRFGSVSISKFSNIPLFDQVGIATTTLTNTSVLRIGAGTSLVSVDYDGVGIGTTANGKKLRVVGDADYSANIGVSGTVTALKFVGDGSGLTSLNVSATGWAQVAGAGNTGIYDTALTRVGIGTSVPSVRLEVGAPKAGTIDFLVNNRSVFVGVVSVSNLDVTGILTSTSYRLDSSGSNIRSGIVTTSTLVVGTSGTVITTTSSQLVGIGTVSPRAKLDIEGSARFKTYSEAIENVSVSGGNVNIDLQKAQTFNLTVNSAASQFTLLNAPSEATSFVIKITQGSTGYSVGIDTFKNSVGAGVTVYWSGGSFPTVTTTAYATDIYRFRTFDQGATLYGIVEGQNFS